MPYLICCNGEPIRFATDARLTEKIAGGARDWDAVHFWVPLHAGYSLALLLDGGEPVPPDFPYPRRQPLEFEEVGPDEWKLALGPLTYEVRRIRG